MTGADLIDSEEPTLMDLMRELQSNRRKIADNFNNVNIQLTKILDVPAGSRADLISPEDGWMDDPEDGWMDGPEEVLEEDSMITEQFVPKLLDLEMLPGIFNDVQRSTTEKMALTRMDCATSGDRNGFRLVRREKIDKIELAGKIKQEGLSNSRSNDVRIKIKRLYTRKKI
jgi:hypothetical protein